MMVQDDMVPDSKAFPSGIKALADYVHAKGLKIGIYSDAGYGKLWDTFHCIQLFLLSNKAFFFVVVVVFRFLYVLSSLAYLWSRPSTDFKHVNSGLDHLNMNMMMQHSLHLGSVPLHLLFLCCIVVTLYVCFLFSCAKAT